MRADHGGGLPDAYLSGIRYELGAFQAIGEIPELKSNPEMLRSFEKAGLDAYCRSESKPAQLAAVALAKTLKDTGADPAGIEFIFYCCEFNHGTSYYRTLHKACHEMGLINAFPIGIYMTGCGNFGSATKLATSLIRSGRAESILLVAAESLADESGRLMQPAVTVLSDGAAACLITRKEVAGGYRILHTEEMVKHEMGDMDPARDFLKYNMENFRGRIEAGKKFYGRSGSTPESYAAIITNNYGVSTLKGFASEFRFGFDRIYKANMSRIGHVGGADNLINLSDCRAAGGIRSGDTALMLTTGPYSWTLTSLEAV